MKIKKIISFLVAFVIALNVYCVPSNAYKSKVKYKNICYNVTAIEDRYKYEGGCYLCSVTVMALWSGQLKKSSKAESVVYAKNGYSVELQSSTINEYNLVSPQTYSYDYDDIWRCLQNGPVIVGSDSHYSVVYGYCDGDFLVQDTQYQNEVMEGYRYSLKQWINAYGYINDLKYYASDTHSEKDHVSSGWIVDEEAQVGQKGLKHKECKICHKVLETKKIPALNPVDISVCKVKLEKTSYLYDGKQKKPVVKVKCGTEKLTQNKDYTVRYSKNTDKGIANVTIRGKGDYTGKITKTFEIVSKKK